MKLRQAVIAAESLEAPRRLLFDLFGLDADYADPGVGFFGLENSVMALGDSFFEIVVPTKPGTTAGRLLERRKSTCGYMVIFQVDDHVATMERMAGLGMRTVWSHEDEKVAAAHIHPKDVGGAIVSFDEMRPAGEWVWGGPKWKEQRAQDVTRVLGCTMQTRDVDGLAARWAAVLDRRVMAVGDGARVELDEGTFVEFVEDATIEGVRGYSIETRDPAAAYARAAKLGLGDERVMLGDVELRFVGEGE